MSDTFTDKTDLSRFELEVGEHLAFARYRREPGRLVILYVEAAQALRGTGAAGELMAHIVDVAQAEGRKIYPVCGYAAAWLKRYRPDLA